MAGAQPDGSPRDRVNRANRLRTVRMCAGILLLTLLAYWPALWGGFIWDDDAYVTRNPLLSAPDGLWRIWFTAHKQSQYFPLTFTTLRFAYGLWGLNPLGYHALNLGLHCINALLVWAVLRRLGVPGAWFAALIFAVHPVQVESVAWITELKNVQSTMFYLLAVLAWIKFTGPMRGRTWPLYFLALLLHGLALLSKTTACTLPAALVLVLWLRNQPVTLKRILQVVPFVALGIGMGLVSVWWEGHLGNYAVESGAEYTLLHRLLIATRALWFYASKVVWPLNLTFSYPKWDINPFELEQYVWLAGCVAVAALLWFGRRRVGRGLIAGIVFFVAALSPLLGFIWLYTFRYSFVADHYQYLACVGLIAPLSGIAATLPLRMPSRLRQMLGGCLAITLACLTWRQAHVYRDLETLWRDTLAKNPASWMAHNNLGLVLRGRGELAKAEMHYRKALELKPDYPEAWNNLGQVFDDRNELERAELCYRHALRLKPNFPEALNNLGAVLTATGQLAEAIALLESALALAPARAEVHYNLANALRQAGRVDEAIKHYSVGLELQPTNARFHASLGLALALKGELDTAMAHLRTALELNPHEALAHRNLGRIHLVRGELEDAIRHLGRAAELLPADPGTLSEFGDTLMAAGLIGAARTNFSTVVQMRPDDSHARFKLGYALAREGNLPAAISEWRQVLALQPDDVAALNGLAWIMASTTNDALRDGREALALAKRAADLTSHKNAAVLDTLAAAYAETGAFDQAVATAQLALELAQAARNEPLAAKIQQHLVAFQQGKPWRE